MVKAGATEIKRKQRYFFFLEYIAKEVFLFDSKEGLMDDK